MTDSESFRFKVKITGSTLADGSNKGIETVVPLKCLSYFQRTPEMLLINFEINFILTWSANCVISELKQHHLEEPIQNFMFHW